MSSDPRCLQAFILDGSGFADACIRKTEGEISRKNSLRGYLRGYPLAGTNGLRGVGGHRGQASGCERAGPHQAEVPVTKRLERTFEEIARRSACRRSLMRSDGRILCIHFQSPPDNQRGCLHHSQIIEWHSLNETDRKLSAWENACALKISQHGFDGL